MFNPLVSVIVPNYNHARYLEQRLDTVFNQTYQNFEVIILDDKSTDNSLEVINRYKDNPHLSQIVVNEQNSGSPFKQWDKGINLAKGELIWIAESDDYNELTFLEELITEWGKHKNVVVAFSNYVMFADDNSWRSIPKERKNRCYNGVKFVRKKLAGECVIHNASGVIFKKSVVSIISKKYMSFKSAGDYMFWTELVAHGNVIVVNKPLTWYRHHVSSVTSNKLTKGITAQEDKIVYDFINQRFHMSCWEQYIAKMIHADKYIKGHYDSDEIKNNILKLWETPLKISCLTHALIWLKGSLERHLGILL